MIATQRSTQPHSHRPPRSPRSPPSISYPVPIEYPSSLPSPSTIPLSSSPTMPTHVRRPSISNPMSWLSRTSTNTSSKSAPTPSKPPYTPSNPIRISEPKFSNLFDMLGNPRSGPLGSGATIVKTPQEALCGSSVHLTHEGVEHDESVGVTTEHPDDLSDYGDVEINKLPSSPQSPPLPPIPVSPLVISQSAPDLPLKESDLPPRPTRPTPSPPLETSPNQPAEASSPDHSHFPILPTTFIDSPPQPPFEAILISPVPTYTLDPSKIIVSLETSTVTHRTTLTTLTSRPSHLASYLSSLFPNSNSNRDSDVGSDISDIPTTPDRSFHNLFHHHLTSSGLIPPSTSSIHVFIDRPSAPYAHLLTYLRTPPDSPATLPRAIQLLAPPSRLDALLDLRDEARYLDLDELHKLCADEIAQLQIPTKLADVSHPRDRNQLAASVCSVRTMRQPSEFYMPYVYHDSSYIKSLMASVENTEAHQNTVALSPHNSPIDPVTPPGWI